MTINLRNLLNEIENHQRSIGFFDLVARHEPKNRPGDGLTAATWVQDVRPIQAASGLDKTSARVEVTTRIYTDMLQEPADDIDPLVYAAADKLIDSYTGDFELGGQARNVDVLGAAGEPLRARAGYLNQAGSLYRVFDVITPIIINDAYTQSP